MSSTHVGDSESAVFRLPTGKVSRDKLFRESDLRSLTLPVSFRAVYAGRKVQIVNTVGFRYNNRYRNLRQGELTFIPSTGTGYAYSTDAPHTDRSYWHIQAAWGNGAWNVSGTAMNLFRTGYDGTWTDTDTPLYSRRSLYYNGNYKRAVAISATYTYGYGKQIRRDDEVGRQAAAESAVME